MRVFLLVFHLLVTLVLIGVILIQRGEDAGAGGGGGGLPGTRSGKNPLTRVTAILAVIFFADCLGMAILIREESKIGGDQLVVEEKAAKTEPILPIVDPSVPLSVEKRTPPATGKKKAVKEGAPVETKSRSKKKKAKGVAKKIVNKN